ncbi:MAG: hypothetical protein M5U26_21970 [Planctomycetota bacterium]|nr:hypothetical protein [Planctomycetota bacterium]
MRKFAFGAVLAALLVLSAARAEDDNPYKAAAVGDWVEYKNVIVQPGGAKMESTMKQTVTAKDDKSVTIKNAVSMMGQNHESEQTINLEEKYEPAPKVPNGKAEKLEEGAEKIAVGGTDYDCKWYKYKVTADINGGQMVSTFKVWVCKDVPISGMVKTESATSMAIGGQNIDTTSSIELSGSGKGK